jgi:hypothetical protein
VKKILLLAGIIGLAGLGALLADVKTDYSHSADFSQYKTYSWLKVNAGDSLWADRIQHAVDMELMAKGWSVMPSGGDVSVSAFGTTKTQPSMQTFYDGLGGGWGWRGFGGEGIATTTVTNQEIGTLNLDLFDSHSKMLIWRGTSKSFPPKSRD